MESISHKALFLKHLAQTSPAPLGLEIKSASGCWLIDKQDKRYLDLIAGIGPSVVGHRHPYVQDAVQKQLDTYWHTLVYGEYVLAPQVKLAKLLADNLPGLDSVYFVNSGAEATEGAMKLAKRVTGRANFVACTNAYHGSTQGAASLMSPDTFTRVYHPLLPGVRHIGFNEEKDLNKIDERVAAVITEVVQGEAGVIPAQAKWIAALRKRCDETGTLLIFDEVQSGMGRTGKLFSFEHYDVVPDILLLAKGLGGGLPLGAFIARKELMDHLSADPVLGHITTFGGHPLCTAAGLATLELLLSEDLISKASAKGALFNQLIKHPDIQEVRSKGLWLALDFGHFDKVQKVIQHCLKEGVVSDWFLFNDRSLRIAPPLTIDEEEIRFACDVINHA
ncbi:MAG: aspartate aminotransferase family protein [Lewinellaceae bacterium]|nr:aspartate aminotransferase family protein [Lewinellaceae bacterium]